MSRAWNFNAGPAVLPEEVLEQVKADLPEFGKSRASVMELSHRGKAYMAIHQEASANVRTLMGLPDSHAVLFLQGGASMQFAMVPRNLLADGQTADYVHTGSWASKAIQEAKLVGRVNVAADTSKERPCRIPKLSELKLTLGAAYVHLTSNETIEGTQWMEFPKTEAPLVADMSSDILSRPIDAGRFALIYAGAQKNIGPAGVTLVIIRKDVAVRVSERVPKIFRYTTHIEEDSLYNTPPCFAIYVVALVTRWLLKQDGLEAIGARNRAKAQRLYGVIDSGFYRPTAAKECRSQMNVTFRLPSEELETAFIAEAEAQGMTGLKGHRSVGGARASIYNAMPPEGVEALVVFMQEFARRHG